MDKCEFCRGGDKRLVPASAMAHSMKVRASVNCGRLQIRAKEPDEHWPKTWPGTMWHLEINNCPMCGRRLKENAKMTNLERIQGMSLEEMHNFFIELNTRRITKGLPLDLPERKGLSYNDEIKLWLESEVEQ